MEVAPTCLAEDFSPSCQQKRVLSAVPRSHSVVTTRPDSALTALTISIRTTNYNLLPDPTNENKFLWPPVFSPPLSFALVSRFRPPGLFLPSAPEPSVKLSAEVRSTASFVTFN